MSIAAKLGITCYIVDPVSVDEAEPLARYSGHRLFTRVMLTHALNMKAVAKRFCAEKKTAIIEQITLLVIHLGTGNSLSMHRNGRMVDAVNPSEEGAFSMRPQRRPAPAAGGPLYLREQPEISRNSKKWSSATAVCSPIWAPRIS